MLISLYAYLKEHGITQRDLVKAAGVTPQFISAVINGKHRFSKKQIIRIKSRFPRIPRRLFIKRAA